jgi:hypothetical protein
MEETELDALPRSYRIGLQLRALGATDELIAECLKIDAESIAALLEIGARKCAQLRRNGAVQDSTETENGMSSETPSSDGDDKS